MKVHIVCERPGADRILPRMSRTLAKLNSWSLNNEPDKLADLNYFVNYITWVQHFRNWKETKLAAYFTHKDLTNQTKGEWWDIAASEIDICTVTANRFAKEIPGNKSYLVRPPVDVDQFTIAPFPNMHKPIIGVSGFVYGDNRKGENLIKALKNDALMSRIQMRASGRGWPVLTKWYPWGQLHKFYQGLDMYICPSSYEGVPMPPLEAMACGLKVVIPRDVGMLDSIPDIPGIFRYKRDDAQDFIKTIEYAAFEGDIDRVALRRYILENYTQETWSLDHLLLFEKLLLSVPVESNLPDWKQHSGVYMVAFGKPARKCAKVAINSIHKYMPGLPVALVSSKPLGIEDTFIKQPDKDIGGRIAKIKVDDLAPSDWQYILYLDADTEVVKDISFLFRILQDGWEFAICKDMGKFATADRMARPDNGDECQVTWDILGTKEGAFQYNGGMMAYRRNSRTATFFKYWNEEWNHWGKRDQGALLRALYKMPLRIFLLPNNWNATDRYDFPSGDLHIIHHNTKARRWSGIIQGRIDSTEAWKAVDRWKKGDRQPI